tara:strand:+ start:352 stop:771 length:420 start_codon:yes stop_codon:yes gene_type:complete
MIHDKTVAKNRDNLLNMIALIEDITRTNNRLYSILIGLMNNPDGITNIKSSIDDLYDKVNNLRKSDINIPLIEEEEVLVPGPKEVSPKEDPDYKEDLPEETPSKEETLPKETRKVRVSKKTRVPKKMRKRLPSPDINSI